MLKLKPANMEDIDEEYKAITSLPEEENGYIHHEDDERWYVRTKIK